MIVNPHGWRKRYIAAKERQAAAAERQKIAAVRYRHYQGLAPDAELPKEEVKVAEPEPVVVEDKKSAEDLTNAELRAALEEAGLEVPKTTARARLIELYGEHASNKGD